MKTKITVYCFALGLFLSSCAKETFYFSNTESVTTYGAKKKQSQSNTTVTNDQADLTAEIATTPETAAIETENFTASTEKTVTLTKKDFTKAKALHQTQANASVKKQNVSKVAQVKAAIKLNKEIKKLTKQAEKNNTVGTAAAEGKSQVIALVLVVLVGVIGIHRFYLGYTGIGIAQLLTLGGCGIWSLIDLVRIITGDLKPKDGDYTTKL